MSGKGRTFAKSQNSERKNQNSKRNYVIFGHTIRYSKQQTSYV